MEKAKRLAGELGYALPNALEGPSLYLTPSILGTDFVDFIVDGRARVSVHKRALAEALKGVIALTGDTGIVIAGVS